MGVMFHTFMYEFKSTLSSILVVTGHIICWRLCVFVDALQDTARLSGDSSCLCFPCFRQGSLCGPNSPVFHFGRYRTHDLLETTCVRRPVARHRETLWWFQFLLLPLFSSGFPLRSQFPVSPLSSHVTVKLADLLRYRGIV